MMVKTRREKGMSALAAVMMIIIMGILGAAFVSLLGTEHYGYLNQYEAAQAFYNANAGVEWAQKQKAGIASSIPFAGGAVSVNIIGNMVISTGTSGRGERVIQVQLMPVVPPSAGCESFIISDDSSLYSHTIVYDNPSGGIGDTVYVKVKSTNVAGCSGGTNTLNWAKIYLEDTSCPNNSYIFDSPGSWSCVGPLTDAGCTDYYEYMTSFNLPGGWSDTIASLKIDLRKGADTFTGTETIIIGLGACNSVMFYSDSGYSTQVNPWEFEKGGTYYLRVITDNLLGNAPKAKKSILSIDSFSGDNIFEDKSFFSLNGTKDITCGGVTYSYASYEGSFTVPVSPPGSGSDWKSEPVADWSYNFSISLEAAGVSCSYDYSDTFKIIASSGGGTPGNPLDVAASEATATQSTSPPGTDWHGAAGNAKKFIIKLFNETGVDIVMTGFDLSSNTSQSKLLEVRARTAANSWSNERIWFGSQSLPTGMQSLNDGTVDDKTIPAGSFIVIDGFRFQNNINPGTFTLTVYFEGGVSSTLTFALP